MWIYWYIFSVLYSTIQFYQTVHIRPVQAETRKKIPTWRRTWGYKILLLTKKLLEWLCAGTRKLVFSDVICHIQRGPSPYDYLVDTNRPHAICVCSLVIAVIIMFCFVGGCDFFRFAERDKDKHRHTERRDEVGYVGKWETSGSHWRGKIKWWK